MSASLLTPSSAFISTARAPGSRHVADFAKTRLVHGERHDTIEGAIAREKLVKKWRREWKFALIEAGTPDWDDLWEQWFAPETEQK